MNEALHLTWADFNLDIGAVNLDRTGHKSSAMVNLHRRAARTAAELGLGPLAPMDQGIPELVAPAGFGAGNGTTSGERAGRAEKTRVLARDIGAEASAADDLDAARVAHEALGACSAPRRTTRPWSISRRSDGAAGSDDRRRFAVDCCELWGDPTG